MKIFFSDVEWSSKYLWKITSADVKARIKQEINDMVAHLTNFNKKYLQNLKYNVKRGCIFHLILVVILLILILSVKNWEVKVEVLLKWQNLLSMTKLFVDSPLTSTFDFYLSLALKFSCIIVRLSEGRFLFAVASN